MCWRGWSRTWTRSRTSRARRAAAVVAVLTTLFASLLLGVFDTRLALVLLAFLVLTGVLLPLATRRLSRAAARSSIHTRSELHASTVDVIAGMGDLLALDRADTHRASVLSLGRGGRPDRRSAWPSSAGWAAASRRG